MTTTQNFNAAQAVKAAQEAQEKRWQMSDISDAHAKVKSLEKEKRSLKAEMMGDRIENIQKALTLGGQVIAATALDPRAQEGLKPLATVAQLFMGAGTTVLSAAFKANARRTNMNEVLSDLDQAKQDPNYQNPNASAQATTETTTGPTISTGPT